MTTRVAVLGGGHGVAAVLAALRDARVELTAIVTTADDGGSSGDLRRRFGGPAVGDLRRSLVALSDGTNLLATVMSRPLETDYGRHPVGNLLIQSLMDSLGDLESSTRSLGEWLGISGRVLPASVEPVRLLADTGGRLIAGESAIGDTVDRIVRLRFDPQWPRTPLGRGASDPGCGLGPARPRVALYEHARDQRAPADRLGARPHGTPGSCGSATSTPDMARRPA